MEEIIKDILNRRGALHIIDGNRFYTEESVKDALKEVLRQLPVSGSLPSKDEAVNVGFRKASMGEYNYRKVIKDLDNDIYYSGWMDCYDWVSGNDR
jgi:hypothetical protein